MNMAMSADGKISTHRREQITLGSKNDRYMMDVLRSRVDAVIIGAGTLRVDGHPLIIRDPKIRRLREKRRLTLHPVNVLLSRSLGIPIRRPFFKHPDTQKILYTTKTARENERKRFAKYAEVIVLPRRGSFLGRVLEDLHGRGFERILVEGGGALNFSFFKGGYVNEIYLTVTPRIIGGAHAPTVVDGAGFLKAFHPTLALISAKKVGQEVFLRYRVRNN